MNPIVVFALACRTKLEQRHASNPDQLRSTMATMTDRLQRIFPQANVVILQDLYAGFRQRPGEFILLAEIANSEQHDGLHVVKFNNDDPTKLNKEWEGWNSCRPHGLRHDIVLMNLTRHPEAGDTIEALIYDDAEQLIGVERTMPLEEAVRRAVLFNEISLDSVKDLYFQLYQRLDLLLYRHADEHGATDARELDEKLEENLRDWNKQSGIRGAVNSVKDNDERLKHNLWDPVSVMEYLVKNSSSRWPRMLRGRSHGDLHARNVLVGQVGRRVLWPAVYDYGKMSRRNWVGLDFVKMETELKIRLYEELFGTRLGDAVRFEVKLFEATELGRDMGIWRVISQATEPLNRLFELLLQLREQAATHLGRMARNNRWLMEYYFLLTYYPLNAVRFDNLSNSQLKLAYLCASCAAARLLYSIRQP